MRNIKPEISGEVFYPNLYMTCSWKKEKKKWNKKSKKIGEILNLVVSYEPQSGIGFPGHHLVGKDVRPC